MTDAAKVVFGVILLQREGNYNLPGRVWEGCKEEEIWGKERKERQFTK